MNWLGFNTQVFNVGNYRRKYMIGNFDISADNNIPMTKNFFDNDNKETFGIREKVAFLCLEDMITFING